MGLDYVELVLAIEDRFQIDISDEEAGSVSTVGDLYHVVLSKIAAEPQEGPRRCLTSTAFYRTRRGLIDVLGCERRAVRPNTSLDTLLPWKERRVLWKSLQRRIGLKMPRLCHTVSVQVGLLGAGVLSSIIIAARASSVTIGDTGTFAFLVLLGLVLGCVLVRITRPLAVGLPDAVMTVGDLAKDILGLNYAILAQEIGQQDRKEVWDMLCALIVEQLGVSREVITEDARILDDLGCD